VTIKIAILTHLTNLAPGTIVLDYLTNIFTGILLVLLIFRKETRVGWSRMKHLWINSDMVTTTIGHRALESPSTEALFTESKLSSENTSSLKSTNSIMNLVLEVLSLQTHLFSFG